MTPDDGISEIDSQGSFDEAFCHKQDASSEEHHDGVNFCEKALDG
jgi:hypothetical protein